MTKEKNTPKTGNHDNKERVPIWLTPSMRSRMNGWLAQDNCKIETEFVERHCDFIWGTSPRKIPPSISLKLW